MGGSGLLSGHFDGVHDGHLCGWIYQPTNPTICVQFLLQFDDLDPVCVAADIYRQDLFDSGIGNGSHSFRFKLPSIFKDNKEHVVNFYDISTNGLLLDSPHRLVVANTAMLSDNRGEIDTIDGTTLRGRAHNALNPNSPVVLELVRDGNVVLEFETDLYRPDLEEKGIGSGNIGFEFELPDAGNLVSPCTLQIRFKEDATELKGSPIGYFNPGNMFGIISRLNSRITALEDRLSYCEYVVLQSNFKK